MSNVQRGSRAVIDDSGRKRTKHAGAPAKGSAEIPVDWDASELTLGDETRVDTARCLLAGFEIDRAISVGPFKFRPSKSSGDAKLLVDKPSTFSKVTIVELTYRNRVGVSSVNAEPTIAMDRAIIAAQLSVDGWIGAGRTRHFTTGGRISAVTGTRRRELADSWHPSGEPVVAGDAVFAARFRRAYLAQATSLGGVIRRYSIASANLVHEGIVDFVISIEGLLGGVETELSHRVSTRGAYLLAKTPSDRLHVYTLIKYLYSCRSKLVHGVSEKIPEPKAKEQAAMAALGHYYNPNDDLSRYAIADMARILTQRLIWLFVEGRAKMEPDWLIQLDLGLTASANETEPASALRKAVIIRNAITRQSSE
jgi:hypothetical protein